MTELVQWLVLNSLHALVLCALLLALECAGGRRLWPQLRLLLWLLVPLRLLLPPDLSSPISLWQHQTELVYALHSPVLLIDLSLIAIWLGGAVLLGGFGLRQHLRERREILTDAYPLGANRAASEAARSMGYKRLPEILISPSLPAPLLLGWRRPRIVLPIALTTAARHDDLRLALSHELAHLKRRDPWVAALCAVLTIVYWFNPAIWLASARIQGLREFCCDARVAHAHSQDIDRYARLLAHTALQAPRRATGVALALGQDGVLARLRWLGRGLHAERWPARLANFAAAGLLLLVTLAPQPPVFDIDYRNPPPGSLTLRYAVQAELAQRARQTP